ncbi:hypothetical protein ACFOYW_08345 [Gryllotalpicola reticulitermitis]|uniref:DnaJ homologue subfamily C member 28 conserved domain-containing protein n=1 Tax=Gryllotalpicola reticulitermitis TaxID=1184153 RepID=A0ABV8Q7D1_9MICO
MSAWDDLMKRKDEALRREQENYERNRTGPKPGEAVSGYIEYLPAPEPAHSPGPLSDVEMTRIHQRLEQDREALANSPWLPQRIRDRMAREGSPRGGTSSRPRDEF